MRAAWLALLATTGCADIIGIPDRHSSAEARCEGSLKIKILYDGSGGTADVGVPFYKGENDLIREINETGGILGCQIDAEAIDYGYDTGRAGTYYDAWKAAPDWDDVVAVLGWGTNDSVLLAPRVRDDHKPFFSASYFARLSAPDSVDKNVPIPEMSPSFVEGEFPQRFTSDGFGFNFFAGTDYSTGARIGMFQVKQMNGKRVGFHYCTTNEFCSGAVPAARAYAKELGLQIGRDLDLPLGGPQATQEGYNALINTYFQAESDRLAADSTYAPVDWVWGGNTTKTMAYLAKAVAAVNRAQAQVTDPAKRLPQIKIMVNPWGMDESMPAQCGSDCVGTLFGVMPFVAYGDTTAGDMAKVMALHDKWRARDAKPNEQFRTIRYVQGYVNVLLFKKAVEKVITSGKEVTGDNIKEALETFRGVDTGGLTEPLTFTPDDHRPQSSEIIYSLDAAGRMKPEGKRTISLKAEWLGW